MVSPRLVSANLGRCAIAALLAAAWLVGCANAASAPGGARPDDLFARGEWRVLRAVSYADLPVSSLKGDLGPADHPYLVTMAAFHTETYGLTVGPDDDVRMTEDGGVTWTKSASELHCRAGVEIVDEKVAWHCGNGGTRRSIDGGRTWQTVAESACPYLSFLDAQSGWAASPYTIQTTNDGGASWIALASPALFGEIAGMTRRTEKEAYLLDLSGALYITPDEGATWERRSLGLESGEKLIAATEGPKAVLRFLDSQRGIVVYDLADRTVWSAVTLDGGRTWRKTEISELRGQSYYYYLYLSRDGTLLTATDGFNNGKNRSVVLMLRVPMG